jgi:hypothetical protein
MRYLKPLLKGMMFGLGIVCIIIVLMSRCAPERVAVFIS